MDPNGTARSLSALLITANQLRQFAGDCLSGSATVDKVLLSVGFGGRLSRRVADTLPGLAGFRSQLFAQGAAVAMVMFIVSAVLIVPYIRSQLRTARP